MPHIALRMNRQHYLLFRLVIPSALVIGASAVASATPCVVGSLQSYIDLNASGGCTIGGAPLNTFFDFKFSSTSTGDATVASASQITVAPVDTPTLFGLTFSATVNGVNLFSTPAGSSVTYYIDYLIDPATSGPDLSLDPVVGNVSATQDYCLNDYFPCSRGVSLSQTVSNTNPPSSLSSQLRWPIPPASIRLIDVGTTITLNGPASFDALNSFQATTVPEPANIVLAGCGLFLFAVLLCAKRRFSV
jgi:hypothetical protein